jgi:hypothetical protein
VIGYVEHEEYEREKKSTTTKRRRRRRKEKEIWSGTDGMYDATRYIYKEKEDGVERFFYMY